MPQTARAAILVEQNAPLQIDDVVIPELDVGQVLVKVGFSGICGKQLEEISGRRGEDKFLPHLLGHEAGGVVDKTGPGVKKVKPGDHVVLHWMKGSGIDSSPPKFSLRGATVNAGWVTTFSEYTIVSENRVTPIPSAFPLDIAALFGCAVTTGLGIVVNDARVTPGQSVAVFGVGGVGLNVVQGAALVSADPIVAVDRVQSKLELAAKFGATHTIDATNPDYEDQLRSICGDGGFDVTVDTTGHQEVKCLSYDLTSGKGRTVWAGVSHHAEPVPIDSFPLHFGRRIVGSHGGDTNPDVDIPRYLKLYQAGKLNLDPLITHRFPLESINDAIDAMRAGQVGRCVIQMNS